MRARLRDDEGANAVEFALLLPVLIMLLLGTFYGAVAYNRQLSLTQAAREAARFGATLAVDMDDAADVAVWLDTVEARAVQSATNQLSSPDSEICIYLEIEGLSEGTPCLVDADGDPKLVGSRVEVRAMAPARFEAVFFSSVIPLAGESGARYERGILQ